MAAVEELGLAVAVKGFSAFISDLSAGDKAIGKMATGWENVGGAAGKAMGKLAAIGQTIGQMATRTESALRAMQPLGLAFSAAAAAGALLIRSSTMIAARNEELAIVLQTVGENAGYSQAQLAGYETAVKGLGITTQSARQSLVQMVQANIDLAHSTDLARLAQDAAVIAQVDSSEAFTRLITIIQTGNVLMGRRLGLNLDFANSNKLMAASLGITTDALTQEQRMQARVNEVMRQGANIAGTYEAAMGSAGKQMRSLNRHWEEAQASLGTAFLPLLGRAVKVAETVLKAFNNLSDGSKETVANILGLGTAFAGLAGSIILVVPRLISMARTLGPLVPLAIDTGIALKALAGGAKAAEVASIGFSGTLAVALPVILAVAAAIAAVYAVMVTLDRAYQPHIDTIIKTTESYHAYVTNMQYAGRAAEILTEEQWKLGDSIEKQIPLTEAQTAALSSLTEGYLADIEAMRWMEEATTGVTDGWMGMLGVATEMGGKFWEVTGISLEAAQAMRDVGSAVMTVDEQMGILKDAIAGPVGEENAKYSEAQAGIRARIDETKIALAEAVTKFGEASTEAAVHRGKLNELKGELGELGTAHRDTMNKIIFDLMMARLATDGWTQAEADLALAIARDMGMIDQETWDAATAMNDALEEFGTGAGQAATRATIRGIASDLAGIERNITIRIHALYTQSGVPPTAGDGGGGAVPGPSYQHGTPFVPRTGSAFLHRAEAVLSVPAAAAYRQSIANNQTTNQFNLTTQSITRPGGLAQEFGAMAFAGAGATR